ncbi:MAG: DEAD/DEAH box helicase [Chromatiales bacterium]|jgi:ATP-dependent RNA helicase DeaD|nr:DEAD/DEAH box helicase [Chromatiales bacterium]
MTDLPPEPAAGPRFADLGLPEALLRAITEVGYETPSPIQAATIPLLLAGRDVVGQAQTGTGKTAAFALPILARLDPARLVPSPVSRGAAPVAAGPAALVLTPTRELAIQVAEAFQKYAHHLPGFHVLPIYGGSSYGPQFAGLRRGAQVVVGTPGRVIDHLERGSLDLGSLDCLVLDEGDEMLRMGFIDDVEQVLTRSRAGRQVALFSATMPAEIRRIARTHLKDPAEVTIRTRTSTAPTIRQRYWLVGGLHKLDALTRILEAEAFDAMLIFVRTRLETEELATKLEARGFAAAALNGDMAQAQRERTVTRLKEGDLDIIVATDVAARGLDVERISHVLNYDIPYDTEAYVHRIGRTGRAGRQGEAILFVTWREQRLLRAIEGATRQPIEPMTLPSVAAVNDRRLLRFKEKITAALSGTDLSVLRAVIAEYEQEHGIPALDIAAALASIAQGDRPLLLAEPKAPPAAERPPRAGRRDVGPEHGADGPPGRGERRRDDGGDERPWTPRPAPPPAEGMARYWIGVGRAHGVKPGNIVGAIANEAGISNRDIGRVEIRDEFSFVELPADLPADRLQHLQGVWVSGRQLRIAPDRGPPAGAAEAGPAERPGPPRQAPGRSRPGRFTPGTGRPPPRKGPGGGGRRPGPPGKPRGRPGPSD